jgi:D-sedoheptulose 7-phosphate isomerase
MTNPFIEYVEALTCANMEKEFSKFKDAFNKYNNIIILGNGGSNSVASHISQDYVKFHNKNSLVFSDPSMLTCFINDFGMENAYCKFLQYYAKVDTLCILISSGGESKNIVNCIKYCENNTLPYGILTGFNATNKARSIANSALWDYHINSRDYGIVECVHQIFLHGVV